MQPPPDPRRELLRFGAGQQVTEIERVEEIVLADPFAFLHPLAVHQRNLPGRPAKAEEAASVSAGDWQVLSATRLPDPARFAPHPSAWRNPARSNRHIRPATDAAA